MPIAQIAPRRDDLALCRCKDIERTAGHPPYRGTTPVEIALAHLSDDVPDLPGRIPEPLRESVRRALGKDPADRYPSTWALRDALADRAPQSAAAPEAPTRRAPGGPRTAATAPTPRRPRRYVAVAGVIAAVLAIAVAAAGLIADTGSDQAQRADASTTERVVEQQHNPAERPPSTSTSQQDAAPQPQLVRVPRSSACPREARRRVLSAVVWPSSPFAGSPCVSRQDES